MKKVDLQLSQTLRSLTPILPVDTILFSAPGESSQATQVI